MQTNFFFSSKVYRYLILKHNTIWNFKYEYISTTPVTSQFLKSIRTAPHNGLHFNRLKDSQKVNIYVSEHISAI